MSSGLDVSHLIGIFVNYPDGHGNQHEGTIVSAYLVEDEIKTVIRTTDHHFVTVWLDNCIIGPAPKPDDVTPPRRKLEPR